MIKTGAVEERVTRCDFCSEPAEDIDDDGIARCARHMGIAPSCRPMKSSAEKLGKKQPDRETE